jgi:hypothetical protein
MNGTLPQNTTVPALNPRNETTAGNPTKQIGSDASSLGLIIGVSVAGAIVLILIIAALIRWRPRRRSKDVESGGALQRAKDPDPITPLSPSPFKNPEMAIVEPPKQGVRDSVDSFESVHMAAINR